MPSRFRSNAERQFKYEKKTKPERVRETSEDVREHTVGRHAARQAELTAYELQAKEAIDKTGIPTTLYVSYLNYCREIWKRRNTYGGAVLVKETDAVIAKWKARDLDETILKQLRAELISVK